MCLPIESNQIKSNLIDPRVKLWNIFLQVTIIYTSIIKVQIK
jgi:hypothetical protein